MRRLGLMMLLVATLHGVASAQETTGTITGVASDQTGAVLPGVTVTVKNIADRRAQDRRHQREPALHRAAAAARRLRSHLRALSGFQTRHAQRHRAARQRSARSSTAS